MDEIAKILSGEASAPGATGVADDDVLLVSERVIGGAPVLFLFRDDPDDGDSGWVLLAGTEPDAALEDPGRFELKTVAWALDADPSLAAVIGAPPDSSFERDAVGRDWVELEEG